VRVNPSVGTTSLRSITENISRTLAAIVMVNSRCREDDSL
jgi:hypothetical protein